MGRDRAAYMREYRARRKVRHEEYDEVKPLIGALKSRVTELEAEVRHLKAELAKRADHEARRDAETIAAYHDRFNTRPFTPVPKRRG